MTHPIPSPAGQLRSRRRTWWLIAATANVIAIAIIGAIVIIGQRPWLTTNVTIPISYVGDDGKTHSCTYDYRTSDRAPMPAAVAENMNARDWSQTGQLMYEWAKSHPAESWTTQHELPADDPQSTRADASWALAMDEYIEFPAWTVETPEGTEYELWWEVRDGSTCEDGLR
ncbi:hypothetical protein [Microbacterium sp. ZW T5_56]|uniref:hypothetical protein n=1 Tax=Microbacterium sp. ZW T5_56 TaxID=3378081 RepID=UPI0038535AB1